MRPGSHARHRLRQLPLRNLFFANRRRRLPGRGDRSESNRAGNRGLQGISSRVGSGPFPTELFDETGNQIRERGNEYGTTTGRARRVGWFDAVAARRVTRLNGVTDIALTLLDMLDDFDPIQIAVGYELDVKPIVTVPTISTDYEG